MINGKNKYYSLYGNNLSNKQLIEEVENTLKAINSSIELDNEEGITCFKGDKLKKHIQTLTAEASEYIKELKRRTNMRNTSGGRGK